MSKNRIIVPDSHGMYIDKRARNALIADMKLMDIDEVVMLGDHVDLGGLFNVHQPNYLEEMDYSYKEDCDAANEFLDLLQGAAPKADFHYLMGNHEEHYGRHLARLYKNRVDAEEAFNDSSPEVKLRLRARGIRTYYRNKCYHGLPVPGVIKLGKCHFLHGFTTCANAAAKHLELIGDNVVFGHTHRAQSVIKRNLSLGEIGSWGLGCLCTLQPSYCTAQVTQWSHGYGFQIYEKDGSFFHLSIPILAGKSAARSLLGKTGKR